MQKNIVSCPLCGASSEIAYADLQDRLFHSPGRWNLYKCYGKDCRHLWINPLPDMQSSSRAYENYYTHTPQTKDTWARRIYNRVRLSYLQRTYGYPTTNVRWWENILSRLITFSPLRRAVFDASVLWLPYKPGGRVLEIGCGNGERLVLLKSLGWDVIGIEPDARAAAIAISRNLTVARCTLEQSNLADEQFDAILMCHVIEHLPDPPTTVERCFGLLKPHGKMILLTPNTDSLGHKWFGRNCREYP